MRMLAERISSKIPSGFGFAIFVFPFNDTGISNYISNGRREDMIKVLEEKVRILKNREDFRTPEEN